MASGSVKVTGLDDLRRAIDRLPDTMTAALQAQALVSARRIVADARGRLRAKTHGTGATADAITIEEDLDHKRYVVVSPAPAGQPANLPPWLEKGTIFMSAKSYMRPAGAAEDAHYKQTMTATAEQTARKVLT